MMRNLCRTLTMSLCTALFAAGTLSFADADARSVRYDLNIPSEDLTAALQSFAIASHHKLLYKAELTAGKTTRAVVGQFTAQEAVEALLSGTGLTFQITGSAVVLIRDQNSAYPTDLRQEGATSDEPKGGKKSSSEGFRLAQVGQGKNSSAAPAVSQTSSSNGQSNSPSNGLSEIIVTAQKRDERLQDVPVPVSVLNADSLIDSNQVLIQDFYSKVPGLSTFSDGFLSIRGITTGENTNPTVGITIDDAPFGPSTNSGSGGMGITPDVDPGELSRIEVLRGPQGTLYGASSMGGLLKYVTVDPSTDALTGRVQAGMSNVYNGRDLGYNVRGSVNVPISDSLAVRASGFSREDPGYIDNVQTGQRSVNKTTTYGGRLAALWAPSSALSVKVSALIQDSQSRGNPNVNVQGLGDLQESYILGTGQNERKVQAYSALVKAKLGSVDLTAVSAYNVSTVTINDDDTPLFGAVFTQPIFGVPGTPFYNNSKTEKFSQELRFSSSIGSRIDWQLGGFYTHEKSDYAQGLLASDPATGRLVSAPFGGLLFGATAPTTYSEYAEFADLTFRLTDRFDVQVGGRESEIRQSALESVQTGAFVGPIAAVTPGFDSSANVFTYLLTPRLRLNPDLMLYARAASGYRAGGPNNSVGSFTVPSRYDPDKTQNFELGLKEDFLDHTLSVDASVYYIRWAHIQLSLVAPDNPNFGYTGNANRAKSQGVELSMEARPLPGLTLNAWIDFADAELTEAFPANANGVAGAEGDRLPYSSRFSGYLSAKQDFPLFDGVTGFVAADISYVGDRLGEFAGAPSQREDLPAYAKTDVRLGANYGTWTFNLYGNNVADKRAIISGQPIGPVLTYIQPRTIGLSITKTFRE
jgi:iron complex outermembrane recepter protein